MSMTNREVLKTPRTQLSSLERQRLFLLQVMLTPVDCPACQKRITQVEALGKDLDAIDLSHTTHDGPFRCPHCRYALRLVVPFIPVGPAKYFFTLDEPLPPKAD